MYIFAYMAKRKGRRKGRKKVRRITVGPAATGIAVAVLLALVCLPLIRNRVNERGAAVPEGSFSFVVDISHHQKTVIWDSLAVMTDAKGRTVRSPKKAVRIRQPDYVVMKASEGEKYRDECFAERWEQAAGSGFRRGAYHYFLAGKDPVRQAQNFAQTVGQLSFRDMAPVLDVEEKAASMGRKEFNDRVLLCLQETERLFGRKPIVYAPDSFINDIFDERISEGYDLWVARYSDEKPLCGNWTYWQFTDKAVIYGVEGKADLSVIR